MKFPTQIFYDANVIHLSLLWGLLLIGTASKPSRNRRIYFFLACGVFCTMVVSRQVQKTQLPVLQYVVGLAAANLICQASDFIFLNEPQLTLRRKDQTITANEHGILYRLGWANDLISNQRGVNWNFEAPGLQRSTKSRWAFVGEKLLQSISSYLVLDFTSYAMRHNPVFQQTGNETMGARGFIWQVWNVIGYWAILYSFTRMGFAVCAGISVLMGEWSPEDYPEMVGPLKETTTVRKFWGRIWHQSLRRMLSAHGTYFANTYLRIPNGTFLSAYTQLFTAFFVSGIIHGAADYIALHEYDRFARNLQYFVLQAVAIFIEDQVILHAKKRGIKSVPKFVGYAWVIIWMAWSGPIWFGTLVTGRLVEFRLPFSVLDLV